MSRLDKSKREKGSRPYNRLRTLHRYVAYGTGSKSHRSHTLFQADMKAKERFQGQESGGLRSR